uniref:Integrase_H2C2 domain-containing protein n=3 Tax=Macrostomum lignano TaxID=282301 RepID=A0A1I8J9Q5_9PLAT
ILWEQLNSSHKSRPGCVKPSHSLLAQVNTAAAVLTQQDADTAPAVAIGQKVSRLPVSSCQPEHQPLNPVKTWTIKYGADLRDVRLVTVLLQLGVGQSVKRTLGKRRLRRQMKQSVKRVWRRSKNAGHRGRRKQLRPRTGQTGLEGGQSGPSAPLKPAEQLGVPAGRWNNKKPRKAEQGDASMATQAHSSSTARASTAVFSSMCPASQRRHSRTVSPTPERQAIISLASVRGRRERMVCDVVDVFIARNGPSSVGHLPLASNCRWHSCTSWFCLARPPHPGGSKQAPRKAGATARRPLTLSGIADEPMAVRRLDSSASDAFRMMAFRRLQQWPQLAVKLAVLAGPTAQLLAQHPVDDSLGNVAATPYQRLPDFAPGVPKLGFSRPELAELSGLDESARFSALPLSGITKRRNPFNESFKIYVMASTTNSTAADSTADTAGPDNSTTRPTYDEMIRAVTEEVRRRLEQANLGQPQHHHHVYQPPQQPDRAPAPKPVKIQRYTPNQDFDVWIQALEERCELNGIVDDRRKKAEVLVNLDIATTYPAVVRMELPDNLTFGEFKQRLSERFTHVADTLEYREQFRCCQQGKNESVDDYGDRLIALADRAFPHFTPVQKQAELVDQFTVGVRIAQSAREQLILVRPQNLTAARRAVLRLETAASLAQRVAPPPAARHVRVLEDDDGQSPTGVQHDKSSRPEENWLREVMEQQTETLQEQRRLLEALSNELREFHSLGSRNNDTQEHWESARHQPQDSWGQRNRCLVPSTPRRSADESAQFKTPGTRILGKRDGWTRQRGQRHPAAEPALRSPPRTLVAQQATAETASAAPVHNSAPKRPRRDPFLTGEIQGRYFAFLLDTGSKCEVLGFSTWHRLCTDDPTLRGQIEPCLQRIVTYNGEPIQMAGQLSIKVKIGSFEPTVKFLLAKGSHDNILGFEFLEKYSTSLDLAAGMLFFKDGTAAPLRYTRTEATTCRIYTAESTTVPPLSSARIKIKLAKGREENQGTPAVIEPLKPARREEDVQQLDAAPALISMANGEGAIEMINRGTTSIKVRANALVGIARPIRLPELQFFPLPKPEASVNQVQDEDPDAWIKEIDIGEDLSNDQRAQVIELLKKYKTIFSQGPHDLGRTHLVTHNIVLKDKDPVHLPTRRIPPHLLPKVDQLLDDLLAKGVIRPSFSSYNTPLVIIPKKDGSLRIVQDFRTAITGAAAPKVHDSSHPSPPPSKKPSTRRKRRKPPTKPKESNGEATPPATPTADSKPLTELHPPATKPRPSASRYDDSQRSPTSFSSTTCCPSRSRRLLAGDGTDSDHSAAREDSCQLARCPKFEKKVRFSSDADSSADSSSTADRSESDNSDAEATDEDRPSGTSTTRQPARVAIVRRELQTPNHAATAEAAPTNLTNRRSTLNLTDHIPRPVTREELQTHQRADSAIAMMINLLESRQPKPPLNQRLNMTRDERNLLAFYEQLEVRDDGLLVIHFDDIGEEETARIVLPKSLDATVFADLHGSPYCGHMGRDLTIAKVRERFWRPALAKAVSDYVASCQTCTQSKGRRRIPAHVQSFPVFNRTTGFSPHYVIYGVPYRYPIDNTLDRLDVSADLPEYIAKHQRRLAETERIVRQRLRTEIQRREEYYENRPKPVELQPGDLVCLANPKLELGELPKFHRPYKSMYKVVRKVGEVAYWIKPATARRGRPAEMLVHRNNIIKEPPRQTERPMLPYESSEDSEVDPADQPAPEQPATVQPDLRGSQLFEPSLRHPEVLAEGDPDLPDIGMEMEL